MLPDIGATELLVIAVVALIVVGPKDLPMLLRRLGQFMAKLRGMAAEFRASFDEMARQSELDELRKEVEAMRRGEFAGAPTTDVSQAFDDINQSLTDVGVQLHPPMSHQWDATTPEVEPEVAPIPAPPPKKPRARKAAGPKPAAEVKTPAAPRKPRAKKIVEGGS
ncbi:Sec-independent protein translocase protein TatB [Phenylobacterium sp.]|uniref:Sec-independent protein translocase protein TatB n=2 Tax=Phenylobacterium sp. TaxID=1871053 RepID=UPI002BC3FE2F|nr:Sec-independent protein translocase protein TatB [Phenylobacterium sp.]HVI33143.1 Sec-independent protein translocase protein TatB [Phenylobacterium sp.]